MVDDASATAAAQTGLEKLPKLRVLFVSNNKVKDWPEVERLAALPALEELLLVGNPLHADFKDRGTLPEFRLEARKLAPCHRLSRAPRRAAIDSGVNVVLTLLHAEPQSRGALSEPRAGTGHHSVATWSSG
jgi:hypothetical protein